MSSFIHRRRFLKRSLGLAAAPAAVFLWPDTATAQGKVARSAGSRVRVGLNGFSFDKPLRDGSMTLEDVVHYCAQHGLDALDATGYYFPGYPRSSDLARRLE